MLQQTSYCNVYRYTRDTISHLETHTPPNEKLGHEKR